MRRSAGFRRASAGATTTTGRRRWVRPRSHTRGEHEGGAHATGDYGEHGRPRRGGRMSPQEPLAGLAEILDTVAGIRPADVTAEALFADLGVGSLTMMEGGVGARGRFGS